MNNPTIDILITTAGCWPYPQTCIETVLAGLPQNGRILVRDNPSSKHDETYAYLVQKAKALGPERFLLFSPDWSGEHGHNMDFLMSKATSDWALIIDSDLEFTDPNWFGLITRLIEEYPEMQCAVEIAAQNFNPDDNAHVPGKGVVPRYWTPRATSWFMLSKPSFVREMGISFGRNDYAATLHFQEIYPYPVPPWMHRADTERWTMENGWQLLWAGAHANASKEYTMVQIPRYLRSAYVHHTHRICNFMAQVGDTPNGPTKARHSEDIPQLIL